MVAAIHFEGGKAMSQGPKITKKKISRAKSVLQDLPELDTRKTRPEAAAILEADFRRALRKGYDPAELSRILKKEGIIIPAYLIEQYSLEADESSKSSKPKRQRKKQEQTIPQKTATAATSFVKPDMPDEEL
ncbi:hypothetical protein [Bilophila wadsworthia]|uniref:hypothetical protein n=1 Tax=Bilophila wadsworthia TaxID=35833 RepID=UPI00267458FF|nr:hypothetical protein [Bilophila wadsworthia]